MIICDFINFIMYLKLFQKYYHCEQSLVYNTTRISWSLIQQDLAGKQDVSKSGSILSNLVCSK